MGLRRVLLLSLFSIALRAQLVNTTSIVGSVTDPSGAPVAGVSIAADIAAYQLPTLYTYGNSGRNMLVGPGLRNLDFSLFRSFSIKERAHVQYRAEFFNLFNTPNFSNPSTGLPSLSAATYSYTTPGSFGNVTSTSHDNRSIQMALKFVF